MSTMTRREKQRIANREGILEAALRIAEREGWPAVTIRKIADEIDYTSPIIYQHFDNKEAALQVLMERGYALLQEQMQRPLPAATPDEQLLNIGRAYLKFVQTQPHLYQLMSGVSGTSLDLDGDARKTSASGVINLVIDALERWATQKSVKLADPLVACEACWGVLHGMASIGMLPGIGFEHAKELALETLSALMQRWEVRG